MAPTIATLMQEADHRGLVRKVRRAVGFLAPLDVDLPEALTGADSLPIDLKAEGFLPIGIVTPEGYRFRREVEKANVDALGYASPIRTDTQRVARQITMNPMHFGQRHLQELRYGVDLSDVAPDAESGEVVFDEQDIPVDKEYRLLVVADDGPATANWILGRGYFAVKVASTGEENWGGDGAVQPELVLDVFTDDEAGVPVRHYLGGTGAKKHADILGYS
jgi:hypothetical protein